MSVNNPGNLFQVKMPAASRIEVDRIIISNDDDPKACDPHDSTNLLGEIESNQNQNELSKLHSSGDRFTMYINENRSTIDDNWSIENARVTSSPSQSAWEWTAQGLTG